MILVCDIHLKRIMVVPLQTWNVWQLKKDGILFHAPVNILTYHDSPCGVYKGKQFEITYIRLRFKSRRPESMTMYKRTSENSPYQPYQYFRYAHVRAARH